MFVLSKVFLISMSTVISTDITLLLFWLKFTHIFPILFSLQDTSQVTLNMYQLLNVNVLHILHSVLKLMMEVWRPMHIHLYHHYGSCCLLVHKVQHKLLRVIHLSACAYVYVYPNFPEHVQNTSTEKLDQALIIAYFTQHTQKDCT